MCWAIPENNGLSARWVFVTEQAMRNTAAGYFDFGSVLEEQLLDLLVPPPLPQL
jgi:hypothetical protein